MSPTKKAMENGVPFCWHCMNRLVYRKGGGFKFSTLVDPVGNEHRVHVACLQLALEEDPSLKKAD